VPRLITLHKRPEETLVVLRDEIDLATVGDLRGALATAVARGRGHVEVDVRAVTFLDCAAIGAMVAGRTAAHRAGRGLFVSHATGFVRWVLTLTGVLAHLTADAPPRPTCGSGKHSCVCPPRLEDFDR
jgi:anti-anti-sigma factor